MYQNHSISAIVNCAGRGTRFGGNKLLVEFDGITVLEMTVRAMSIPMIDQVVVTVSEDNEDLYRDLLVTRGGLDVTLVVGAEERHLSAMRGLSAATGDIIVVHDGVRPFVTPDLIEKTVVGAVEHGAAMIGLPSTVQVKLVNDEGFIDSSLDRSHSWLGQTPQAFKRELLASSYEAAVAQDYQRVSDDADLVAEFTGIKSRILPGHDTNIKITTPQDLGTARLIFAGRKESAEAGQ